MWTSLLVALASPAWALVADTDGDGLSDLVEAEFGTDPANADTDADGLSDGDEVFSTGTDPLAADTDADGYADGADACPLEPGGDALADGCPDLVDGDGDGIDDALDLCPTVADPAQTDTDADGIGNACEVPFTVTGTPAPGEHLQLVANVRAGERVFFVRGDSGNVIRAAVADAIGQATIQIHLRPGLVVPGQELVFRAVVNRPGDRDVGSEPVVLVVVP